MKKSRRALPLLFVLALLLTSLAGCGDGQSGEGGEDASQESSQESIATEQPSDSTDSTAFSWSESIDENGYWEGVTALDHVELFDYRAISIPSDQHEISDGSVQDEIDGIMANFSSNQQVLDRAIEDGDTVNIDYVGSVDGVEFEGGTTGGMGTDVTIGVTSYIDDFLEQLIGHMPGETVNVEVTFPENYGVEELNGKDALFVTVINYIVEAVEPDLSDEFVAENFQPYYGWSTVAEMNQGISSDLQRSAIQSYIQEYLIEHAVVLSLPDALLTYMERSMLDYFEEMAAYYGVALEDLLAMYEGVTSTDELIERYRDSNEAQAGYYLVMQAVAEDAGIVADEADVAAYFADTMGTDDYSMYEAEYGMPYLKQVTMHQMVLDYLADFVVLE